MSPQPLLEQVLEHTQALRFEALPAEVVQAAVTFITDSIGVALAGSRHPRLAQVLQAAQGWGQVQAGHAGHGDHAGGGARDWASGQRWPAPTAALLNAYQVHNQEFDCVHERAVVHPLATILPTLVAQAEAMAATTGAATGAAIGAAIGADTAAAAPVSGAQLIEALVLAVDLATTLGCAQVAPMRFFRPAMCGALGAALGAAKLAGCSRAQMADALGLAYSQLAGTMQAHSEGSPALALQVGFAARAALMAVDLARAGFSGPHDVLQGPYGYFDLFDAPLAPRLELVRAVFAEVFLPSSTRHRINELSHKPFPTGRAAHGALDGLARLQAAHGFTAAEVGAVTLAAPPLILRLVGRPWRADMDVNYARLCLPYLAATQLRHGAVRLQHFEPAAVADASLQALAEQVRWVPNEVVDANALAPQTLSVSLHSGPTFSVHLPQVLGHPSQALSIGAQQNKFEACCAFAGMAPQAIQNLAQGCAELPQLRDLRDWVDLMQVHPAAGPPHLAEARTP